MRTLFSFFAALSIFAGCSSSNHYSALTKQQAAELVAENVSRKDFTIDVDRALPSQGRSVSLTGNYTLRIDNDTVYSYLPYYGRAYSLPYGGGEGMIFEGAIENYTIREGSKGEAEISFTVRTREDNYSFNVTVWESGSSTITVNPTNKQLINYSGKMRLEP